MSGGETPASLRPGAVARWTRTITTEDVVRFAELSGDKGRHHVVPDARGRLMAHGLLTATLPTKLGGDLDYVARTMTFDFVKAVYSGDVLVCEGTVASSAAQSSRWRVRLTFEVRNQDGEVVLRGDTSGFVARAG